jgi:acetylornithine deacetylase/succinyl-diaminopimelate desuccinylase-like protein
VLTADRRLLPGATQDSAVAELRTRIDALKATHPDLAYDIEVVVFGEASELNARDPFADQVRAAIAAATGEQAGTIGMAFTTDARFVRNQLGIPAVVCGPGDVAQAHVHDEYVAVDRLVDAAAAYAELYASFGS